MIDISLKSLEQTGALEILYLLLKKGRVRITETLEFLRKNEIGQTAMYNAIKTLKENGLIEDVVEGFPRSRYLMLTDVGRQIAEKVSEIKDILDRFSVR